MCALLTFGWNCFNENVLHLIILSGYDTQENYKQHFYFVNLPLNEIVKWKRI